MKHPVRAFRTAAFSAMTAVMLFIGSTLPVATTAGAQVPGFPDEPIYNVDCVNGMAGPFRCHQIDLKAFLPPDEWGGGPSSQYGGPGNDVWGWTDPQTGAEWVIMGRADGTSFIDISDPASPVFVANLPKAGVPELHSDMKVYKNYAFVVSEFPDNGMQVFDLTRLRDIDYDDAPVTVDMDAHYTLFDNAHDIVIDEDSGFAYAVGTGSSGGVNPCTASLHMIDIRDPLNPTYAGCYNEDGYTHDAQCVTYRGPDQRFQGREICFLAQPNGIDRVTVVDVTDKSNPVMLSSAPQGDPRSYSHQGWLTPDQRYFIHNDESDEIRFGGRTRTRIFDVQDLTDIKLHSVYHGETHAADHNLYTKGNYVYLTNYFDGLRLVTTSKIDKVGPPAPDTPTVPNNTGMREVACFDTDPTRDDIPGFGGVWSNYPYFKRDIVAVSGFDGLWILQVQSPSA
ncbi:MAG TPA: choice-of-anchor B family protein, partial [Actinomycetota bacterium]|nr:choice-of-anchor B family protein [Actinomycetota bacterium]